MGSNIKIDLPTAPSQMSNLSVTETNTHTLVWNHPSRRSTRHSAIEIHWKPSLWKSQWFISTGIDTYSKYEFVLPAQRISASTTIHRLMKYLIHYHKMLCNNELDQSTTFIKRYMEVNITMRTHQSCHISHHPNAASLTEWNGLWNLQLRCQFGDDTLPEIMMIV